MNPNPEKRNDWLSAKIGAPIRQADYEFADRAIQVHSHWVVGYDEPEIAAFFHLTELEVAQDLQWVRSRMTPRQINVMDNDRDRIKLHRVHSREYSRLLEESLKTTAKEYIAAGMSPVGPMKEYRQAVGMEEKPGGLAISFNNTKNTANIIAPSSGVSPANLGGGGKIRSFEDLVRSIIAADPSCGLQPVIDTEAHEALPLQSDTDDVFSTEEEDNEPDNSSDQE
jgi:hypothetical protein